MRKTFFALLAGLCLLLPGYFGSHDTVGILSPDPMLPFIFAGLLERYRYWIDVQTILVVLPAALFLAWNPSLLCGQTGTPKRTYVVAALVVVLDVAYLVASWNLGVKYEGIEYTAFVTAGNVGWIAILSVLFISSWKGEASFAWNLALHWVLFAWLAWFAFPYLGEPI
jgi:hypothetical protein